MSRHVEPVSFRTLKTVKAFSKKKNFFRSCCRERWTNSRAPTPRPDDVRRRSRPVSPLRSRGPSTDNPPWQSPTPKRGLLWVGKEGVRIPKPIDAYRPHRPQRDSNVGETVPGRAGSPKKTLPPRAARACSAGVRSRTTIDTVRSVSSEVGVREQQSDRTGRVDRFCLWPRSRNDSVKSYRTLTRKEGPSTALRLTPNPSMRVHPVVIANRCAGALTFTPRSYRSGRRPRAARTTPGCRRSGGQRRTGSVALGIELPECSCTLRHVRSE